MLVSRAEALLANHSLDDADLREQLRLHGLRGMRAGLLERGMHGMPAGLDRVRRFGVLQVLQRQRAIFLANSVRSRPVLLEWTVREGDCLLGRRAAVRGQHGAGVQRRAMDDLHQLPLGQHLHGTAGHGVLQGKPRARSLSVSNSNANPLPHA